MRKEVSIFIVFVLGQWGIEETKELGGLKGDRGLVLKVSLILNV